MGLDWRRLSYYEFTMHLAGWNAAHKRPDEREGAELTKEGADRLRRFTEAHSGH